MNTMALYLIGDVQGCDAALQHLLDSSGFFSPSRDTLYLLGDLVNRGPDSAGVLRRLMAWALPQCLLGNHDLNLLAVAFGGAPFAFARIPCAVCSMRPTAAMLDWLRHQHMAMLLRGDPAN
jgi:bis(5'-nucleosyl)-tetraphosphatase (symmetrical)